MSAQPLTLFDQLSLFDDLPRPAPVEETIEETIDVVATPPMPARPPRGNAGRNKAKEPEASKTETVPHVDLEDAIKAIANGTEVEFPPKAVDVATLAPTPKATDGEILEPSDIPAVESEENNIQAQVEAEVAIEAKAEIEIQDEAIVGVAKKTAKPDKKAKQEAVESTEVEGTNIPADWHGEKQYYTIGEVADLFKVKTSHIRFWTNEFNLKVRTTRKGDRLYTTAQIKELRAIYHLVKERGFTLTGAKAKLKEQNKRVVETIDLKDALVQLRGRLVAIRKQLN